jgi:hypothetical protein
MKKSPTELINISFSVLMIVLTLAGFIVFMFTDYFSDRAVGSKRYILAIIFLAYSIYRSYRVYSALKSE